MLRFWLPAKTCCVYNKLPRQKHFSLGEPAEIKKKWMGLLFPRKRLEELENSFLLSSTWERYREKRAPVVTSQSQLHLSAAMFLKSEANKRSKDRVFCVFFWSQSAFQEFIDRPGTHFIVG